MTENKPSDAMVEAMARALTKAQRAIVTGEFASPFSTRAYGQIRGALVRKGLFYSSIGVTPLGLAVRAILQEQSNG